MTLTAIQDLDRADSTMGEATFFRLWAETSPRLHQVVASMLQSREAREDVIAETQGKAWQNRHRFDGRSTFSTWVIGIGRNCALDALRKRRRKGALSLDVPMDVDGVRMMMSELLRAPREDDADERLNVVRVVLAARKRFPVCVSMALRIAGGEAILAIAEKDRVPVGTVKSRAYRGRRALRAAMLDMEARS